MTCGNGENGRLGLGSNASTYLFSLCVGLGDLSVSDVACGTAHTAVATADGGVFTFGDNRGHQLGHSAGLTQVPVPLAVDIPEAVVRVATGYSHSLALTRDGDVYAWGDNSRGQTGASTSKSVLERPAKVLGLPRMASISAGATHSLGLSTDGEVFAWGGNDYGQVGVPKKRASPSLRDPPAGRPPR